MKFLIGIDIGGSKISVVKASEQGKILARTRLMTHHGREAKESLSEISDAIGALVPHMVTGTGIGGLGFAIAGLIDSHAGRVVQSPNLPGWERLSLKTYFKKRFPKTPLIFENDATAAALGEKFFGGAKALNDFAYVTVSTGIGSGIYAGGNLLRGTVGLAGELGHVVVVPDGRRCHCGKRGCLEVYASGTALAEIAREAIRVFSKAKRARSRILQFAGGNLSQVNAFAIEKAAKKGDRLAGSLYQDLGKYLGIGLANLAMLTNPEAIFLGGSVSKAKSLFYPAMMRAFEENTWAPVAKKCKISLSGTGNHAGDFGAVALVLQQVRYPGRC